MARIENFTISAYSLLGNRDYSLSKVNPVVSSRNATDKQMNRSLYGSDLPQSKQPFSFQSCLETALEKRDKPRRI